MPTTKKAKDYGNNVINFKGEVSVTVRFGNTDVIHTFLVVDNKQVPLLGRDLCSKLNISMLFPCSNTNHVDSKE